MLTWHKVTLMLSLGEEFLFKANIGHLANQVAQELLYLVPNRFGLLVLKFKDAWVSQIQVNYYWCSYIWRVSWNDSADVLESIPSRSLVVIQNVAVLDHIFHADRGIVACGRESKVNLRMILHLLFHDFELFGDDSRWKTSCTISMAQESLVKQVVLFKRSVLFITAMSYDEIWSDRQLLRGSYFVETDSCGHVSVCDLVRDSPSHIENLESKIHNNSNHFTGQS